jgi:hypothetical protein
MTLRSQVGWLGALFFIVMLESHAFAVDCCESVTKHRITLRDSIQAYIDTRDCQNLSLKGNQITGLIEGDTLKCCLKQAQNYGQNELNALTQMSNVWREQSNSCKPRVPFGK